MEFHTMAGPVITLSIDKYGSTKFITNTDKAIDFKEYLDGYFRIFYPDNEDLPVPITPELEALGCETDINGPKIKCILDDEKYKVLKKYVFDYGMREVKIEIIPVKCIMGGEDLDDYELELTEKSIGQKILVFSDFNQEEEHTIIERLFMKEDEILGIHLKNGDSYILDYKNCVGLPKLKKFSIF